MRRECARIGALLYRVAEGEATPDDALQAARHVSDCTTCRIVLARERRLAAMLEEGLDDPVPVGEDFVDAVMARLPQGPPPPAPRKRKRRTLKLAGLAGLIAVPTLVAALDRAAETGSSFGWSLVPRVDVPLADGFAEGALRLGGLLLLVLDRLATAVPLGGESLLAGSITAVVWTSLALMAVGGSAGAAALATGRLLRDTASRSA